MRVLAVGSHPDDCELGAGGTLAKHVLAGDHVTILVLTGGAMSRDGATEADKGTLLVQARAAADVIGAQLEVCDFPDQRLDTIARLDITKRIERVLDGLGPEIVYTHSAGDLNLDHRITCEAVQVACRPVPGHSVRALYSFEVQSSTEWGSGFRPTVFVEIPDADHGEAWRRKVGALACYRNEMRATPHPRSPEGYTALALWRGMTAGYEMAEAFELVREIR